MASNEENSLKNQIYGNMQLKETDELIEIWKRDNRAEWSDTAFEVVKEILLDRLGELPPQEPENVDIESETFDDPYHSDDRLLKISSWANILSWVILALYIVRFFGSLLLQLQGNWIGLEQNNLAERITDEIFSWLNLLVSPAIGLMYYLLLQAISEGILLLMDFYENKTQELNILKELKR